MDDDILDDEQLEELSESESEAEVTINGKRKVAQPDQPSPKGNTFFPSLPNLIQPPTITEYLPYWSNGIYVMYKITAFLYFNLI